MNVQEINDLKERRDTLTKTIQKDLKASEDGTTNIRERLANGTVDMDAFNRRRELKEALAIVQSKLEFYERQKEAHDKAKNIPKRFRSRTFDTYEGNPDLIKKLKDYADDFASNEGNGFLLMGNVGTGKTHLSAAVVNYLDEECGIMCLFMTSTEMFDRLKNFEDVEMPSRIKNTPLLVIDDLGKEQVTEWKKEKLFDVINYRYENCLPVIITTNLNPAELSDWVGDAIFSRMKEMCTPISTKGKDYRSR